MHPEGEEAQRVAVKSLVAKDEKFIKRRIQDIERKIDDLKESLEERLQQDVAIDDSVILVTYAAIMQEEDNLSLYENFREEYL